MKPTLTKQQKVIRVAPNIGNVKPYCLKDLCYIYFVTEKTMKKWLKPYKKNLGTKYGRYYSARQVQLIIKKLGMPYSMREKEDGSFFEV